jgi:hypothetical protein
MNKEKRERDVFTSDEDNEQKMFKMLRAVLGIAGGIISIAEGINTLRKTVTTQKSKDGK